MLRTVQIATDSLTKKEVTEFDTVYLAIDGEGYELHLSKPSRDSLDKALAPFLKDEANFDPIEHYWQVRRQARALARKQEKEAEEKKSKTATTQKTATT